MTACSQIRVEADGDVEVIALDRPEARNAVTPTEPRFVGR